MKIYTKKGDQGTTGLIGGTRILKSSLRIESYGTVDELNSYIGLVRDLNEDQTILEQLLRIQDRLFTIGSHLAADPEKSKMKLPDLTEKDVEQLEQWMDVMDEQLEPMRSFVLPGGHVLVSHCHIARCICRRAERVVVDLNQNEPVDGVILKYINRLSDYLFILSRKYSKDYNANEQPWVPQQ
ncbi:MAG TPA: cob(I)yrinic acid a,c-diamide adenosyltransferase [Taishania sp.]|nr:cob(I)yrinic acid a,c-diamide adenosyltransferase [Taishania sp.]